MLQNNTMEQGLQYLEEIRRGFLLAGADGRFLSELDCLYFHLRENVSVFFTHSGPAHGQAKHESSHAQDDQHDTRQYTEDSSPAQCQED